MTEIRRMVLDILKPHEPGMTEYAQKLTSQKGVESVNLTLVEVDEEVENIKATVKGNQIRLDSLRECVDQLGGSIHSIDEIVCGEEVIEQVKTPQD